MGTSSFLFPICHDGPLYGKVQALQAARRQMLPVWMDPVLLMREDASDASSDEEQGWPGLEDLLPVYKLKDRTK